MGTLNLTNNLVIANMLHSASCNIPSG